MEKDNQKIDWEKFWEYQQIERRGEYQVHHSKLNFISKIIRRHLSIGGKVLDVGFSDGYLLQVLAKNNYNLFGIDISVKNIAITAKELGAKGISVKLVQSESKKMPFVDDFFDLVFLGDILEHLDNNDLALTLQEVYRVLRSGGRIIITTPYRQNIKESLVLCPKCSHLFEPNGHMQSFDEKNLAGFLCQVGFKDIKQKKIYALNLANNFLSRFIIGWGMKLVGFGQGITLLIIARK